MLPALQLTTRPTCSCCLTYQSIYGASVVAHRLYSTQRTKKSQQIAKGDQNLPPPLKANASPNSQHSIKKPIEPRLTPKKPEVPVSSLNSQSGSVSTLKAVASFSSVDKQLFSNSKALQPHLMQPVKVDDLGIIKTALNDIDDALSNGTLQPLPSDLVNKAPTKPENAGAMTFDVDTARVWWHKLKEMTKFYFFGVTKLGKEHRSMAREVKRRLEESERKGVKGVNEWRDKEFLRTYRIDLARWARLE